MMKLLIVLVVAVGCIACGPAEPLATRSSSNPHVKVEVIAVVDGLNVYRLYDGEDGPRIYFVAQANGEARTSWVQPSGKTSHLVAVDTVARTAK